MGTPCGGWRDEKVIGIFPLRLAEFVSSLKMTGVSVVRGSAAWGEDVWDCVGGSFGAWICGTHECVP